MAGLALLTPRRRLAVALAALGCAGATPPVPSVPDYAAPASWICRPGVTSDACAGDLDAVAVAADGTRTPMPFVPAANPPVDCFYLYPTSSTDPTPLSDLNVTEERQLVHDQAARLTARCRLFAPKYHQITIAGLKERMAAAGAPDRLSLDLTVPYRDVLAAWRYYLAHDNGGRGVVLVGHSQGALLIKRLIAQELDGRPAGRRLVAAYMAGILTIDTRSFRTVRPCRAAAQAGCYLAWSSYAADHAGPRLFGRAEPPGTPVCVDPAAVDGAATVKAYLRAPSGSPRWWYVAGQIGARCATDARGAALRIAAPPAFAAALPVSRAGLAWDLHPHDIDLVQGDILDLIPLQAAAWARRAGR